MVINYKYMQLYTNSQDCVIDIVDALGLVAVTCRVMCTTGDGIDGLVVLHNQ